MRAKPEKMIDANDKRRPAWLKKLSHEELVVRQICSSLSRTASRLRGPRRGCHKLKGIFDVSTSKLALIVMMMLSVGASFFILKSLQMLPSGTA